MVIKIEAERRTLGKKSDRKNLRKNAYIPGIMYGQGEEGIPVQFEATDFMKAYRTGIGELAIFNVMLDGEESRCVLKDKQIHPVRRDITHVDFLLLHPDTEVSLSLPVRYVGEAAGLEEGGIVDIILRELNIVCLPKDIPESVEIDISELQIGDAIHVGSISIPNVTIREADDITMVVVHDVTILDEPELDEEVDEEAETDEEAGDDEEEEETN